MAVAAKNLKANDKYIDVSAFRTSVLDWYEREARILPWRAPFGEKPEPYHEWLSEIMLQQTVVYVTADNCKDSYTLFSKVY